MGQVPHGSAGTTEAARRAMRPVDRGASAFPAGAVKTVLIRRSDPVPCYQVACPPSFSTDAHGSLQEASFGMGSLGRAAR